MGAQRVVLRLLIIIHYIVNVAYDPGQWPNVCLFVFRFFICLYHIGSILIHPDDMLLQLSIMENQLSSISPDLKVANLHRNIKTL